MFQHTAARRRLVPHPDTIRLDYIVSTHSRPKAAGISVLLMMLIFCKFQHTAARRRLGLLLSDLGQGFRFQHTAARRRLDFRHIRFCNNKSVSTHSRPKAAGNEY
ncbi:hypothetical protein [Neisseria sicca]|uniref:hypothetical protein n=1 Tax=Neisseria sicca TaxID=490 RepID=UPI000B02415D